MFRKVFLAVGAVAALSVMASPALAAKGGNSAAAKACQKGAWQTLSGSADPGAGFASQDACTGHAANGGTLVALQTTTYPVAKQACEDAGYTYDEPGGLMWGDSQNPIHFTCGSIPNDLTVDQAWNGPVTPLYGYCYPVLNAWTTINNDGSGWYAVCYGQIS